ncbi:MAG TPA: type II secretion system F family protein [Phycisphaerae bacterium]|nr:type II secretion system F family protein [Phycisphaerae bacterium]HUU20974.1 type II secretion system F family protein [Phycisphaerae bacterium]
MAAWAGQLNLLDLIVVAAVFGLILAMWMSVVMVWRMVVRWRQKRVDDRLGLSKPKGARVLRLWHEGREATTTVVGTRRRPPVGERMATAIRSAGWEASPRTIVLLVGGVAVVAFLLPYLISGRLLAGAAGGAAWVMVFRAYMKRSISKQAALFDTQYVDALDLARRSLRAGHPLVGAFRLVANEVGPPVGPVFAHVCQEHEMGRSIEEAIRAAADRSASEDLKLLATSVSIQVRSGGNLAEMIDRLADVIRERIRLNRRMRVLTAQTQFSKRILVALPLVLFVVVNIINPDYIEPMYSTTNGQILLAIAGAGIMAGSWVMNKMATLNV